MATIKKSITFFLFVLFFQTCFAQFEGLQINLEVQTTKKEKKHIRLSLYHKDSTVSLLGIKYNPIVDTHDYKTWLKRDVDTIIEISTEKFNRIAEMSMNLSSSLIIEGAKPSNPKIGNDGVVVNLELVVTMDKISYNVWSPMHNTKERNLESFLDICKEILLSAKLKSKEILK